MARDSVQFHPELIARRLSTLKNADPASIATMSEDELLSLQSAMGYGDRWGEWAVPAEWLPAGGSQRRGTRIQTMRRALTEEIAEGDPRARVAWTELLRLALLRSLVPGKIKGIPKPSTVLNELYYAIRVVRLFLPRIKKSGAFWALASEDEVRKQLKESGKVILATLRYLHAMGYLSDAPSGSTAAPRSGHKERNRKGVAASTRSAGSAKQWQPLPDDFVSECGWRVLWVIKQLGPSLLDAMEAALDVKYETHARIGGKLLSPFTLRKKMIDARDEHIAGWLWITPSGEKLTELPFSLHASRRRGTPRSELRNREKYPGFSWPPRSFGEVMRLIYLLQGAHAYILLLSAGPRSSEVLSYSESCLVEVPGGFRVVGRTFKLAPEVGGRKREFPAPAIVVQAARQQLRLARIVKKLASPAATAAFGDHFWIQATGNGGSSHGTELHSMNGILESLLERFGLRHLLGENSRLHTHRFRKTLARLVALTLTNAQMILMDCFGHEDPEMTLQRYILSDPLIRADVVRIQRELVVLMAEEAIQNADDLGGPVAARVQRAKAAYLLQSGKSRLEPKDIHELAESLTRAGRDWVIISPGVICSLPAGFTGPCARRQGGRNPAYCRSGCEHQLLTRYNKSESDDMVSYILEHLKRAVEDEAPMMVSMWVGQLRNWLYRWREVYEKWSAHPLVQEYTEPWDRVVGIGT